MNREVLYDKFINGSLNSDEQLELQILLEDDDIQKEFVEYTVETRSFISILHKQAKEPKVKVKKQSKPLKLILLGAAAIIAVLFYLEVQKYTDFRINGETVKVNTPIKSEQLTAISYKGSKLTLMPGTELKIISNDPPKVLLAKGELKADISPQTKHFEVMTETTSTKVLGTVFTIDKAKDYTDILVEEGKVNFSSGGKQVQLKTGEALRSQNNGLFPIGFEYRKWISWSKNYAENDDVLIYLNFLNKDSLNNIAKNTAGKIIFERRDGEYARGRWPEKMALLNGGLESLDNKSLGLHNEYTVWAWVKLNKDHQPKDIYPPILNANDPQWRLQLSKDGTLAHAGHNTKNFDGKIPMAKGSWHFLAATFTNSQMTLFVNGKADSSFAGENTVKIPESIKIGYYKQFTIFRIFSGAIDEIAVQKGALTEKEINEIYLNTKP